MDDAMTLHDLTTIIVFAVCAAVFAFVAFTPWFAGWVR
jgi:hypothetical protein